MLNETKAAMRTKIETWRNTDVNVLWLMDSRSGCTEWEGHTPFGGWRLVRRAVGLSAVKEPLRPGLLAAPVPPDAFVT